MGGSSLNRAAGQALEQQQETAYGYYRCCPNFVAAVPLDWWKLKVPNVYKEAAWRLTLNAFPMAERMDTGTQCVACGVSQPGVCHHFWSCPVAVAVREEVEGQLRAFGMLPADGSLRCAELWMGLKPAPQLHRLVWDLVCLASVHAMNLGRQAAWAVRGLEVPVLVADVAVRAACADFWSVLADLAVSVVVPEAACDASLAQQPFVSWHEAADGGGGMRVRR